MRRDEGKQRCLILICVTLHALITFSWTRGEWFIFPALNFFSTPRIISNGTVDN